MIMDSIVSSSSMEMSVESKTNAWLNKTNQDQQQQRDHDQQREHSELKLKKKSNKFWHFQNNQKMTFLDLK